MVLEKTRRRRPGSPGSSDVGRSKQPAPSPGVSAGQGAVLSLERGRSWVARALRPLIGYLLVVPSLAIFVTFFYVPAVMLFVLAFYHWNVFGATTFRGLGNFSTLFNQPLYWQSLLTTGYFVLVMVPLSLMVALALALLLREGVRQARGGFARSLIFLPHVTPLIATSIIWVWIFNPQFGLANFALTHVGLPRLGWLEDPHWAMPAIMLYTLWHSVGLYTVLFLAGLSVIPEQVVEAARVDGARAFTMFRRVIWPLLSPTTFLVLILTTVNTMQAFGQIFALTGGASGRGGGPAYSTSTDAVLIYQTAFTYYHLSLAATMSLILFVILLVITLVQKRLSSRWVFYR
ncbi:MAG: carbohydrate ABC transporter permease [Candidatus Dormibacteria bacterium]